MRTSGRVRKSPEFFGAVSDAPAGPKPKTPRTKSTKSKKTRVRLRSKRVKDRPYSVKGRIITDCAPIHGSHAYEDGNIKHIATRGTRAQVMNGTAHHTCSGPGYTKELFRKLRVGNDPETGRGIYKIISVNRHLAGKAGWRIMHPDHRALMEANQFAPGKKGTRKDPSYKAVPHTADEWLQDEDVRTTSRKEDFEWSVDKFVNPKLEKRKSKKSKENKIHRKKAALAPPPPASGRSSRTRSAPSRLGFA